MNFLFIYETFTQIFYKIFIFPSNKQNLAENLSEGFINEQEIHQKELEDNEIYNKMIITKVVIIMFKHVM